MRPLGLRWLSIVSETRPRLRYDAEFQGRAAAPDVEFQCLPCFDLAQSFGFAIRGDCRQSDAVTGDDSIAYLEPRFLGRQTAPELPHKVVTSTR